MDLFVEEVEGEDAIAEDDIVKFADVEPGAEKLLRFGTKAADFELADFVREALAGPGDVAIDFGDRFIGRMLLEESDGLLASPAHGVHAGIDDETDGAEAFAAELAEAAIGIAIDAELLAERFDV